jgi:hypothetical protein
MWPIRTRAHKRPVLWPVHSDVAAAETRAHGLRRRFRKISRRWERPDWRRQWKYPAIAFVGAVLATTYLLNSPWPVGLTLRHLVAFTNCDGARTVGLAPARRGEPGYWSHNDADNDGIACEPYRRALRSR